jgi:hypothetical protein
MLWESNPAQLVYQTSNPTRGTSTVNLSFGHGIYTVFRRKRSFYGFSSGLGEFRNLDLLFKRQALFL